MTSASPTRKPAQHTRLLSLRAPARLVEHLDRLAAESGDSRSGVARVLLATAAQARDAEAQA